MKEMESIFISFNFLFVGYKGLEISDIDNLGALQLITYHAV